MKTAMVIDQLARAGVTAPDPAMRTLDNDEGRTTIRAAVENGRAGYRMRGSHDIVVPDACEAVDPFPVLLFPVFPFPADPCALPFPGRLGNRNGNG